MLELYCGTVRVEVRSEEIVQPAKSRPVDAVAARKQIEKTGNTMCIFEQLTVSVEDGLFFPLRALNELRRQGIEALTEKLLGHYTRDGQPQQERGELTRADVEKVLPKAERDAAYCICPDIGSAGGSRAAAGRNCRGVCGSAGSRYRKIPARCRKAACACAKDKRGRTILLAEFSAGLSYAGSQAAGAGGNAGAFAGV